MSSAPVGDKKQPSVVYDRPFWLAYASCFIMAVAVVTLYRYADFVTLLGGAELHLGWIVGIGMIGSFFVRLALGTFLDRRGARMAWIGSSLLMSATCFAHLAVSSHTGLAIYLLRILFCCSVAGYNGAAITFVSMRVPSERIAESVGMLGTGGFFGTIGGALLSDVFVSLVPDVHGQVVLMFVAAGTLSLAAMPFSWLATKGETIAPHKPGPSLFEVLRRYNPGAVLAIGFAMGFGLGLPNTFLRPYAAELDILRIGLFFTVYSLSAIITRVVSRRWTERFGPRPIIFIGLTGLVTSLCLFLIVRSEWQLVIPAVGYGFAHALLFPAAMAAGSMAFPIQNRGLATVIMLAAWDLGQLVGAPMAGAVLHYSAIAGWPAYPTMFLTMAGTLALIGLWYATRPTSRRGVSPRLGEV